MTSLSDIADIIDGSVIGDPKIMIDGVSPIDNAESGTITFIANSKYEKFLDVTNASAIISDNKDLISKKNGIVVNNPKLAIAKLLDYFSPNTDQNTGVHDSSIIDTSAIIGQNTSIGANTVIEADVIIGNNVVIGSNNVISNNVIIGSYTNIKSNIHLYPKSEVGESCIVHSGCVIGADGYGYITLDDIHTKIPHIGKVIIGNNVEIGANCTIDRGTIGDTIVNDHCKFDNGVQIAHNVVIGKGCLLTAHVTIAGSTKIGEFCVFGGQSGAIDNITIGDRSTFACYTAVTKDLKGGRVYSGAPAREIKDKNRRDAVFVEVKQLKKRLKELEAIIK